MLLAEVLVQAARERSTENCVENVQGEIVFRRTWNSDTANSEGRLGCARLVDEIDSRCACLGWLSEVVVGDRSTLPPTKQCTNFSFYLRRCYIPDDD